MFKGPHHGLYPVGQLFTNSLAGRYKPGGVSLSDNLIQTSRETCIGTPFMALAFEMFLLILFSFSCMTMAIPTSPNEVNQVMETEIIYK